MFAKTIIDSDAFLDMPLSTQALYFHLSMRADDEGFINNPKKVQRMIGATEDDMKILITKNFVICFETGIIVIKHWRIHNYIRADRLVETKYKDERELLEVKENGAYTFNKELLELEQLDAKDKRKIAYKESSLPYCFTYKIRRAFEGRVCPVCNKIMKTAYKTAMPTIQHNLPISKGGKHELENISVICESCNTSLQDTETDALNNEEVIDVWDRIIEAERQKIKWMDNPDKLEEVTCLSNDSQMSDTCQSNVRIGKDRLGKDRLGKDRLGEDRLGEDRQGSCNYQQIADMYNDTCVSFPRLTTLSEARKKAIKARLNVYSLEDFQRLFTKAQESTFLKGANNRNWSATFDWLIKDTNMAKVLDGNYDNRGSGGMSKPTNKVAQQLDDFYKMAAEFAESEE